MKGSVYLTLLNIIYSPVQLHPLPDVSAALTTAHMILAPMAFVCRFSLLSRVNNLNVLNSSANFFF